MKVRFAEIDGHQTRFLCEGSGPPLMLLQPIGHSGDVFIRNIEVLAASHTVIAPDLPGHGFSAAIDFGAQAPQSRTARHLGALADHLGFEHYAVVGSSYGGLIAALMWFERPERIKELVVVGSGSVFHPPELQRTVLKAVYANASQAMANRTIASCRQRLANICYSPASVSEEILLVQATYYALPDRFSAYQRTIQGLIDSVDDVKHGVHSRLEKLTALTLVITGRDDIRAKLDLVEQGCARLPNAELAVFERCGHLPYMEYPARFNELVLDFLNRARGKSWRPAGPSSTSDIRA